ncbi:LacI family DNA-binding transcriptional regulator [Nonomuraea ferruginea]|uniref:LacI family DNA-binding transcriptional regulator n=1 Tax=Nonomuraea ferruginea TaxID=46174 RepID=A0ABT4T7P6_9ACTN|nr:LacI family DNA-binding transcriptional regulator [Nonomuraea ferruginea]MDA0645541.1 LacI family DNA-binding transcriptional regulator [Nonomuraea ferruginea]
MRIGLKEVAAEAGVSRSTASRALSGSPLISAETRAAVEEAAARLNYRPNRLAGALRTRQSHLVGLVLNNLINASFHTIAEVVQRRAAAEGYQVMLGITDADPAREKAFLLTLAAHGVDGIVMIGTGKNGATTNALRAEGVAVVNVIRRPIDSAAPAVLAADREGAHAATAHLLDLGHERIGFIGGEPTANSGRERFAGYEQALRERGLDPDASLIERGPFTPAFGTEAIARLLGRTPRMTALFAANHEAVFGILPTLASTGVAIPGDLSLVCYEDIPWLRYWSPAITVVDNGASELGELAMNLLLHQLKQARGAENGETPNGRAYRVGAQLILRDSTAPRARSGDRPSGPTAAAVEA